MLSHPAASPPALRRHPPEPAAPADCPLPPAADKRLTPLIVLLRVVIMHILMLIVEVISSHPQSANHIYVFTVIVLLLYGKSSHIRCGISLPLFNLSVDIRLFLIPGFAENSPSCRARLVPGPSLAGTHFGP